MMGHHKMDPKLAALFAMVVSMSSSGAVWGMTQIVDGAVVAAVLAGVGFLWGGITILFSYWMDKSAVETRVTTIDIEQGPTVARADYKEGFLKQGLIDMNEELAASTSDIIKGQRSTTVSTEETSSLLQQVSKQNSIIPPDGVVTVVFTDIEESSTIWRRRPEAMKIAMRIHNKIMRDSYAAFDGYEVKTIGDAFMIAFTSASSAVNCCLKAQLDLLKADWPEGILTDTLCSPENNENGVLIHRGLNIRMGIHTGPATREIDPITERSDYFGHTVNMAARIEAASAGGAIACSNEVLRALDASHVDCDITPAGKKKLKGVGMIELSILKPKSLPRKCGLGVSTKKLNATPSPTPMTLQALSPGEGGSANEADRRRTKRFLHKLYGENLMSDNKIRSIATRLLDSGELQMVTATVVHVRIINTESEPLRQQISFMEMLAERTFGIVMTSACPNVVIVWMCEQHAMQAASFAGLMAGEHELSEKRCTLGMASGGVAFGVSTTSTEQYVTCLGTPVDFASSLAEAAEIFEVQCLTLASIAVAAPALHKLIRPVDFWPIYGESETHLEICEINVAGLMNASKWEVFYGGGEETRWFDIDYIPAFQAAKEGDITLMREILAKNPDDHIAKLIVDAEGKQMSRKMVKIGKVMSVKAVGQEALEEAWVAASKAAVQKARSHKAEFIYINDQAYEVHAFMKTHPGGKSVIQKMIGKDATAEFNLHHDHNSKARIIMKSLRVKTEDKMHRELTVVMNTTKAPDVVLESWENCKALGLESFGILLYRNLFETNPSLLDLFPFSGVKYLYESKQLKAHAIQVMAAIDKSLKGMEEAAEVVQVLHSLGASHARWGVKENMFDTFHFAFDKTLRMALQEKYTASVRAAWLETAQLITDAAKVGISHHDISSNLPVEFKFIRRETRNHNVSLIVIRSNEDLSTIFVPPGSHISLKVGNELAKQYSISRIIGNELHLLVKLYPEKKSSIALKSLEHGDCVVVRGPFLSEYQNHHDNKSLGFIGGGTGVVPLISLAADALIDPTVHVTIMSANSTPAEIFFNEEIEHLKSLPGTCTIIHFFTRSEVIEETPKFADECIVGSDRLRPDIIDKHFPESLTHFVVCGPATFNKSVSETLRCALKQFTVLGD